jgi:hypothetical protein
MTIEQSRACDMLGTYFKIPRKTMRKIVDDYFEASGSEGAVVSLDLDSFGVGELAFAASKSDIVLGDLFSFKDFEKSDLYADALDLLYNNAVDFVVFIQNRKGKKDTLCVLYEMSEYSGYGGVFLKAPNKASGYVVEPLKNYLQYNYPNEQQD